MLEGKNISKYIGGNKILEDINLKIQPGRITSVIGPSGSGKSTLLNCLSLLTIPTEGSVIVNEEIYSFQNEKGSSKGFPYPLVTVVFQGLFLWPHLSNEENIQLPLKELKRTPEHFDEVIGKLDIRNILKKYPNECSGGEKQRVALARQLLLKPQYLLLDEVTSALDLEMVNIVANILSDLKEKGTGILLVTHMVNLARSLSDDFYFLDKGVVVESGPTKQMNNPESERLQKFLQIYS
jgi:ABC-type polar amino acid transport system ATPase subunit